MDTLALAAAATVMAAIFSALLAVYQSTASPRGSLERRLGHVLGESTGFQVTVPTSEALRPRRAGHLPFVSAFLEGRVWTQEMAGELERGDIKLTVGEFVATRIFLALMGIVLVLFFTNNGVLGLSLAALAGFIGYLLPMFYLRFSQGRRLRKLNNQLVEALSMLANSLKAGFGLIQSMDLVSRELQHPIATEVRRTLHDINVGASTEDALQHLAKRCGSNDLDIVITAMLIQQSTGGNLAEILENVGHTMRERIRIRGEITTLTTQQLLTGFIVGGLPFVIAGFIMMLNPGYLTPLFHEFVGQLLLGGALLMELFGVVLIKRILDIEV